MRLKSHSVIDVPFYVLPPVPGNTALAYEEWLVEAWVYPEEVEFVCARRNGKTIEFTDFLEQYKIPATDQENLLEDAWFMAEEAETEYLREASEYRRTYAGVED